MTKKTTNNPQEDALSEQINALTLDLKRTQADFINYKNRATQDSQAAAASASKDVLQKLLPILDNLERAINSAPKELASNDWAQGVVKIAQQLDSQLQTLGVQKIATTNAEFDPMTMEAISAEGDGETEVVEEELQAGYLLNGEVLRAALVKIVKKSS